jgi:hypothetical protein
MKNPVNNIATNSGQKFHDGVDCGDILKKSTLKTNPCLHAILIETIEYQLREGRPPETWTTLERLMSAGNTRRAAIEKMAGALAVEIYGILKRVENFDEESYILRLECLT